MFGTYDHLLFASGAHWHAKTDTNCEMHINRDPCFGLFNLLGLQTHFFVRHIH